MGLRRRFGASPLRQPLSTPPGVAGSVELPPEPPREAAFGHHIWKLLPLVKPYKARIAVGLATNAFARLFDLLPMVIVGLLVDRISVAPASFGPNDLWTYALLVLGTFAGLALFQSASDYAWDTLAQKVRHDLRTRLYDHLQGLDVAYFEERQAGDIMSVLSSDVDRLEDFLSDATTSIVRLVITFLGIFGFLLWLDWRLALLLFAPLPLAVFTIRYYVRNVQPQYRRARRAIGAMNAVLENNLQGIGVIQAYTAEAEQAARVRRESEEYRDAAIAAARLRARFLPTIYLIAGASFASLIGVGGWLTFSGAGPTLGDYVVFILFGMRLIMPLFVLGMLMNQIQRSEAAARRVQELLGRAPVIVDAPDAVDLPGPPTSIRLEGVRFSYPGRPPALQGVFFEVHRGQVLGVVGHTGAGKSTLVKLLLRYHDPQEGRILVDGLPLGRIRLRSLRSHVGYVSQDAFLFSGTVRENIALGSPHATQADIEEAARVAGAHDFIAALPQGYGTLVGERGLKLSGGQRQRVSLARAVLRNPAILLLDEATSAVDTQTEAAIQANLHRFRSGRITLAVAHRLSTVRRSDEILVLVDGVVVERGTHDALVARSGVYADLWDVQSGQPEETPLAAAAPAPARSPASA